MLWRHKMRLALFASVVVYATCTGDAIVTPLGWLAITFVAGFLGFCDVSVIANNHAAARTGAIVKERIAKN